ncbi:Transposon Ty4-J Gag-Pol polyprotein (TY4A-TY4B) (Transposon Ty4 TYA-TYB polyprotein) [Includes: Capsid protein (CA), partial [Durusdinium trenchii]
ATSPLLEVKNSLRAGSQRKAALNKVSLASLGLGDEHRDAFKKCKDLVRNSMTIAYYDPARPVIVLSDASEQGWAGAVLQVPDEQIDGPLENMTPRLLGLVHQFWSDPASRWHIQQREAFGLVETISRFAYFLQGDKPARVLTDNANLVHVFTSTADSVGKQATDRLFRWSVRLSAFNLVIRHVAKVSNALADLLSRVEDPAQNVTAKAGRGCSAGADAHLPRHRRGVPNQGAACGGATTRARRAWRLKAKVDNPLEWITRADGEHAVWLQDDPPLLLALIIAAHNGTASHRGVAGTAELLKPLTWSGKTEMIKEFRPLVIKDDLSGLSHISALRNKTGPEVASAFMRGSHGSIERLNREIVRLSRALASELRAKAHDWHQLDAAVHVALNWTPKSSLGGLSPGQVFLGGPARDPEIVARVEKVRASQQEVHDRVRQRQERSRAARRDSQNKDRSLAKIARGDWVWLRLASGATRRRPKAAQQWVGPMQVAQCVRSEGTTPWPDGADLEQRLGHVFHLRHPLSGDMIKNVHIDRLALFDPDGRAPVDRRVKEQLAHDGGGTRAVRVHADRVVNNPVERVDYFQLWVEWDGRPHRKHREWIDLYEAYALGPVAVRRYLQAPARKDHKIPKEMRQLLSGMGLKPMQGANAVDAPGRPPPAEARQRAAAVARRYHARPPLPAPAAMHLQRPALPVHGALKMADGQYQKSCEARPFAEVVFKQLEGLEERGVTHPFTYQRHKFFGERVFTVQSPDFNEYRILVPHPAHTHFVHWLFDLRRYLNLQELKRRGILPQGYAMRVPVTFSNLAAMMSSALGQSTVHASHEPAVVTDASAITATCATPPPRSYTGSRSPLQNLKKLHRQRRLEVLSPLIPRRTRVLGAPVGFRAKLTWSPRKTGGAKSGLFSVDKNSTIYNPSVEPCSHARRAMVQIVGKSRALHGEPVQHGGHVQVQSLLPHGIQTILPSGAGQTLPWGAWPTVKRANHSAPSPSRKVLEQCRQELFYGGAQGAWIKDGLRCKTAGRGVVGDGTYKIGKLFQGQFSHVIVVVANSGPNKNEIIAFGVLTHQHANFEEAARASQRASSRLLEALGINAPGNLVIRDLMHSIKLVTDTMQNPNHSDRQQFIDEFRLRRFVSVRSTISAQITSPGEAYFAVKDALASSCNKYVPTVTRRRQAQYANVLRLVGRWVGTEFACQLDAFIRDTWNPILTHSDTQEGVSTEERQDSGRFKTAVIARLNIKVDETVFPAHTDRVEDLRAALLERETGGVVNHPAFRVRSIAPAAATPVPEVPILADIVPKALPPPELQTQDASPPATDSKAYSVNPEAENDGYNFASVHPSHVLPKGAKRQRTSTALVALDAGSVYCPTPHSNPVVTPTSNGAIRKLSARDAALWEQSKASEVDRLVAQGTFASPTPFSEAKLTGDPILPTHFIFSRKHDHRLKSRLVCGGDREEKLYPCAWTSPTSTYANINVMAIVGMSRGWHFALVDIAQAFTIPEMPRRVWLRAPPELGYPKGTCVRLAKSLYGVGDAPLIFFRWLLSAFLEFGLTQSHSATVDDCAIWSSTPQQVEMLRAFLAQRGAKTTLQGHNGTMLGMRYRYDRDQRTFMLDMADYEKEIIREYGAAHL